MAQNIDDLQIEINSSSSKAVDAIDSLAKSLSKLMRNFSSEKMDSITNGIRGIGAAIGEINPESLSNLSSVLNNIGKAGFKNVTSGVNAVRDSLNGISQSASKATQAVGQIGASIAEATNKTDGNYQNPFDTTIEDVNKTKTAIGELLSQVRNYKNTIQSMESGKTPFNEDQYREAFVGLEKAQAQLKSYKDAVLETDSVTDRTTGSIKEETSAIGDLIAKVREYKNTISSMESGKTPFNEEGYREAFVGLDDAKAKLKEYKDAVLDVKNTTDFTDVAQQGMSIARISVGMDAAATAIRGFSATAGDMSAKLKSVFHGMYAPVRHVVAEYKEKFSGLTTFAENFATNFKNIFQKLPEFLHKVFQRFTFTLLRTAINEFLKDMETAITSLRNFSGTVGQEFNSAITSVQNNLATLRGSIVAAFAPLVSAIAPIIDFIIQKLVTAINVINQFFAALTGRASYAVVKNTKAVGGYAGAANKATEAQKKLNASVLAFDQLNKLDAQDDPSSGGGGGGGGAGGGGIEWEELPVDENIKKWADKVKEILAQLFEPLKKAWDRAGKYVIDGFKYMVRQIGLLARDIGRDFLTMWNEEATVQMLTNILLIIGDIERVVGNLAKKFRQAWNQNKIGLKIFEKIRDIIANLVQHVRNVTKYMIGWSDSIDFYPLLDGIKKLLDGFEKIADFVGSVFEDVMKSVVLKYIKWMIEEGMPHLAKKVKEVIDAFDFKKIRNDFKPLWSAIEGFLENLHTGIANAIGNVGKALANFANSDRFTEFIQNIANFLNRIDSDLIEKVFTALGYAIITIADAVVRFVNSDFFQGFINWLFDTLDGMTAEQIAAGIVSIANAILVFDFIKFVGPGVAAFIGFIAKIITFTKIGEIAKNLGGLADGIEKVGNASKHGDSLTELADALDDVDDGLGKVGRNAPKAVSGLQVMLTTVGGLTAAIVGAAGLGYGLQALVDKLEGGNGKLTEFGSGLESYMKQLQQAGHLTSDQAHTFFLAIEEYETGEKSLEETTALLVQMLKDTGVSADEANRVLQQMYSSGSMSEAVFNSLAGSIGQLGSGFEITSGSVLSSKVAFDDLSEGMLNAANQMHLNLDQISQLEQAMYNQDGSTKTAEEAYNSLIETMQLMGLNTDTFINALNEKIPGAVNLSDEAINNLKGSVDDTMQSVGDSVTSYGQLFDSLIQLRDQGNITSDQFDELKQTLVNQHDSGVSASDAYDTVLEHMENMSSGSTTAVGTMKEGLSTAFDEILADITGFGEGVGTSFGEGVATSTSDATRPIDEFGRTTVQAMHDSEWRFGSPSQTAIDFGKNVVEGFNQGITENAETSGTVIQTWLTGIVEKFNSFSEQFSTSFTATSGIMNTFVTGFTTALSQISLSLQQANTVVTTFSTSVNQAFTSIGEGVTAKLLTLVTQITNSFNLMKQAIQTSVTASSQFVKTSYDGIRNSITNTLTAISQIVKTKFETMKTDVRSRTDNMKQIVEQAFTAIRQKVDAVMQSVVSTTQSRLNEMKSKFESLNLRTTGENVIQGFYDGLQARFPAVLAWAQTAAAQIAATFASALQMGSPSKLFRKFGEYTVEGYMIGVKQMTPKSTKLISSWGDSVSSAYSNSIKGSYSMNAPSVEMNGTDEFSGEIINGVYEAVAAAMQNYNPEITVYSELKTDDEALARSVTRGQKNLNRRYSPVLR